VTVNRDVLDFTFHTAIISHLGDRNALRRTPPGNPES
jgi:hypothetical protein